MPLSTFLRTARRTWFVPAAMLAVALAAVFVYEQEFGLKEAVATVAVLDPLTTRPGAYVQAQITFDSIVKSEEEAVRVGAVLGRDPGSVRGHLSVSISPSLETYNASPVYSVYATDKTYAGALALADAAVEQGRLLYIEKNTPDPEAIRQALASQMKQAQSDLDIAVAAYSAFLHSNDAIDLEPRIGKLRDIVYSLQLGALEARADEKAQMAAGNWAGGVAARKRAETLESQGASEQAQLDKLLALEIPYGTLAAGVQTAQTRVNQLKDYETGTLTGEQLPLSGQIKIIDHASRNSHQLTTMLTYGIGALVGLLAGATAIYLLGLIGKEPETAEEIGSAFGAPILARVPVGTA